MTNSKPGKDEKQAELQKYRALVLATLDYYLDLKELQLKTPGFDSQKHYQSLKIQTGEHYQKGRLTTLKKWFRDLAEMHIETRNLKFNNYLQEKTGYDIDIFQSYFQRTDKIIEKGKITTDSQFYDINTLVDQLCQTEPVNKEKIDVLNRFLNEYEQRKGQKKKKPAP